MRTSLRWAGWSLSGFLALAFLTQPVSVGTQLGLSLGAIGTLVLVWLMPRTRLTRALFMAVGSFVVLRYAYWRVTSTLPSTEDPLALGLALLLLAAEGYCLMILVISLIINADPLERKPLPREPDADLPTVDIFIPTYNEDETILATTVAAARALDYPADKFTVWLLDDGGTDQKCNDANAEKARAAKARRSSLQQLCAELGARYLTRAKNEHAKAGNLNNGLQASQAEIVVVFDADHAPFRSFLRETVGHFARDPRLFLVQTPHVFLNPDPIERNLRTFERMPSENEMFYAVTQRGLDKWNGSFFCGSAALLRRAALAETGGFSGITITEDCETAFELHAKGWTSVYVDKPLIAGLQPETFDSFIGQRSRWCQGMFQILILKNPALRRGLKPIQRLAYLSSMTFWMFPLPRLFFMLAPLLHIFFDIKIFVSNLDEAVAYTATYVVVNLMMQNYLYGRFRWPWMSELYEYVQGVFLAKAIVSVAISPRKPTFNVTAKGLSLEEDHLSSLAGPFFAIYALLLVGAATAAYRYCFEPGVSDLMLVVGLWNVFGLITAGAALGTVAERRQPDRHPRLAIRRSGVVKIRGVSYPVAIEDVSAGGCRVRFDGAVPPLDATRRRGRLVVLPAEGRGTRETLPIGFPETPPTAGDAWWLTFDGMRIRDHLALADLMYGDAGAMSRFLESRRRHKDLLTGTLQFLWWGISEPVRATIYAWREFVAVRIARAPAAETVEAPVEAPVALLAPPVPAAAPAGEEPSEWMRLMLELANHDLARERDRAAATATEERALVPRAA